MTQSLDTTFNPAELEKRWYAHWESTGGFRPERPDAEPFTIVNPPPNVTGSLHIGHALDNTLQDIVIRYERLRGKDALWVVGTDHAGIATQMVVERQMEERQDKRTNYSREEFVDKVWEWKHESGGQITHQLRRLGCSMDWSREQFTMDPHFTKAVLKTFVDLYNDGLIYRDKRLVNWDPKLKTAISDLEVEQQTIPGNFWHFKYPLADGVTLDDGRDYIEVATTRPETMLADMAVAVHPSDERYASVVGKEVVLPITGRRIPIVADEHADPELGSGAVKITPGHDFNDFEVGKRAGIAAGDMLNMLDGEANVCQTADGLVPDEFIGLHRFKRDGKPGARELVVERLKELGCLIPHVSKNKKGEEVVSDAEPRQIATPFGDRGGVVIEPWLTTNGMSMRKSSPKNRSRTCATARSKSSPRAGRRPSSTGWKTSSHGVSLANCGGGTGFRLGSMPMATPMSPRPRKMHRRKRVKASYSPAMRTSSTHGSPLPSGLSPRSAGQKTVNPCSTSTSPTTC